MAELANCSRCEAVFVKMMRDICQDCYKEEETAFKKVYRFLSDQKNREATMDEIIEATGIEASIITKFIREKRLRTSQFPKLTYPCERCSANIITGKLCIKCSEQLRKELKLHEETQKRLHKKYESNIYYAFKGNKK